MGNSGFLDLEFKIFTSDAAHRNTIGPSKAKQEEILVIRHEPDPRAGSVRPPNLKISETPGSSDIFHPDILNQNLESHRIKAAILSTCTSKPH